MKEIFVDMLKIYFFQGTHNKIPSFMLHKDLIERY